MHFFAPPRGIFAHAALATPDIIFAAAPNQHTKSVRSVHVVQPLAQFLAKKVKLDFEKAGAALIESGDLPDKGSGCLLWLITPDWFLCPAGLASQPSEPTASAS